MELTGIDIGVFALYILVILGVGVYASRRPSPRSATTSWPATSSPGG